MFSMLTLCIKHIPNINQGYGIDTDLVLIPRYYILVSYRNQNYGIEPSLPHTDVSRNRATVVIRGVLPGLRRRRTGLLPSGPKSSFQMRASFVFHLETKVLESGGRVEKLIAQVS